jgi:hypothetical protein
MSCLIERQLRLSSWLRWRDLLQPYFLALGVSLEGFQGQNVQSERHTFAPRAKLGKEVLAAWCCNQGRGTWYH